MFLKRLEIEKQWLVNSFLRCLNLQLCLLWTYFFFWKRNQVMLDIDFHKHFSMIQSNFYLTFIYLQRRRNVWKLG